MKIIYKSVSMLIITFISISLFAQNVNYSDSWNQHGITLQDENSSKVLVNYSLESFIFNDFEMDGQTMKVITVPGIFLPNDAGAPDLPGTGQYIAIPQGSKANIKIVNMRTEVFSNVEIAPAPVIPLDTDDNPLEYKKDMRIYGADAYFPAEPIKISAPTKLRGVDVVMLGVTPFQYNPVTKELIVYRDVEIEIAFEGGKGHFGEDRLRSRWWEPMLSQEILNYKSLPEIDFSQQFKGDSKTPDFEYLIISPNDATFLQWADSIKLFRNLQGINTGIVTTAVTGNTVSGIQSYVDNAYNNWNVPPAAVLLLGDYGTGSTAITSEWYSHPAGYPDFVSDNYFADVTGNNLPDIVFARMTAQNASQLEVMITKFLDYERNPPTDYDFYNHPITALGWQTERWFQICSEVVGGYLKNVKGKDPVRINAIYSGTPGSVWSTATNTSSVVNYFGPNGYGYIPSSPSSMGGWSGGNAADVINAINAGSFMLQHRDHGSYDGWGEPAFQSTHINSLTNVNNKLPYIFSINCQTGAFHRSSETFAEKFHRHTYGGQNSGALGVLAATEVSYSFVNDTYMWGVMDNMFPDFMGYSSTFPVNFVLPAFGNAAGKNFLYSSSWPYNPEDKLITYRLFHHHGDAFLNVYTEVPQSLTVVHAPVLLSGATSFAVSANAGSFIALTVDGEILGTANGTGSPVSITIPSQFPGAVMIVTVTKQNYFRYSAEVPVVSDGVYADFTADNTSPCIGTPVDFTDISFGDITSWSWSFPGGTPSSSNAENPPAVYYSNAGTFNVTLTVSDGGDSDTRVKNGYITVTNVVADFTGAPTSVVEGNTVTFTDNSSCNPTSWSWSFEGGTPATATGSGPHVITYYNSGNYNVSLNVSNANGSDSELKVDYITVIEPNFNMQTGSVTTCSGNFYDSGGPSGPYSDYEDLIMTFYPSTANAFLEFTFTLFDIEYQSSCSYDWLKIYNGINTSSPLMGTYCGTDSPGVIDATNASGALTFVFHSDYSVTDVGWAATINCIITSAPPIADFVADDTTPAISQVVNFTDLTQNDPTSWQWTFNPSTISYIGGTNQFSQNPQVHFNNSGYYTVTLVATNADGNDTETKTNYILVGTGGIWTGNTSTDWNTGSNWENLLVPEAGDDVVIPSTAVRWPQRSGDITLGVNCNSISLEGNSELTITGNLNVPVGRTFTCNCLESPKIFLYGNMSVQGDFIAGTGFVSFEGTGTSLVTAGATAIEFYDVFINKNDAEVSFNNNVNVNRDLIINEGAYLTNNTGVVLNVIRDFIINNSTSAKSSFIDLGTTTVYGSSSATMEYMDNRWYNISAPVNLAMSMLFYDMYLYYYDEAASWHNIFATDYWMEPGAGYLFWTNMGNPIISWEGGVFNTGDYTPDLQFTDRNNNGSSDADEGWNMIGNAYPSSIDLMASGYTWNNSVSNTIYLYNGSNYATFNRATGVGSLGAVRYIPSMQGFFAKVTRRNPPPELIIPNTSRVHDGQMNYKDEDITNLIRMEINQDGVSADEMVLLTIDEATVGYDDKFDAYKLYGFGDVPMIYTIADNDKLAVNAFENFNEETVIPVCTEVFENGLYQISFTSIKLKDEGLQLFLEDLKTNEFYAVSSEKSYPFNMNVNDESHRFNLYFGAPNGIEEVNITNLTIFSNDNKICFSKENFDWVEVQVYNMLGEQITSDSFSDSFYQIDMYEAAGYYLVKAIMDNRTISKKVLIK